MFKFEIKNNKQKTKIEIKDNQEFYFNSGKFSGIKIKDKPITNWRLFQFESGYQRGQYLPKDPVPSSVLKLETDFINGKIYCENCLKFILLKCNGCKNGVCKQYKNYKKLLDKMYLVSGVEDDFEVEYNKIIISSKLWKKFLEDFKREVGIDKNTLLSEFTDFIIKKLINHRLKNIGSKFTIE